MKARTSLTVVFTLLWSLGAAGVAIAQRPVKLVFTEPEEKVLTVRREVELELRRYAPPFTLTVPVAREAARYDTPESTLAAAISAAFVGDEKWLLETMSEQLAQKKAGRSAERRAQEGKIFDGLFRDKRLVLTQRLSLGDTVLIRLSSFERPSGELLFTHLLPFRKIDGQWRQIRMPRNEVFRRLLSDIGPEFEQREFSNTVVNTPRPLDRRVDFTLQERED
jgi:hypothetical protein